jgi:murein DD-endopeptidase MepM/ murein hydrolase activator NlpD
MLRRYTVIVIDKSGRPIKKASVSTRLIFSALILSFILIFLFCLFGYNFHKVKAYKVAAEYLQSKVTLQTEEIHEQRRHIQAFANQLNRLKDHMARLDELERKIRKLADIETDSNDNNYYGIGGFMPDDLNSNLDLDSEHGRLVKNMHEQVSQLKIASGDEEKNLKRLLGTLKKQRNILSATPSIMPTEGHITSRFGYRKSPFTGRSELHKGLDISNKIGTSVMAAADGVVSFAGPQGSFGQIITIDHGHGLVTYYAHLSKFLKKEGDHVKKGEIIAEMGSTGRTTGPHLHYEVRLNGVSINPIKYIEK